MKQSVTILLLSLLIYNSLGYYLVFYIQHEKAEDEFQSFITSGNYQEDDLELLKIPTDEYAALSGTDFNRVTGDIKFAGKYYELVRLRIENDTVFAYCLNNEREEQLYQSLAEHIQNNISDSKTHKSKVSNLIHEYLKTTRFELSSAPIIQVCENFVLINHSLINNWWPNAITPPPRTA